MPVSGVRDPGSEGSSLRIPHPAPRIPTRVSSLHTACVLLALRPSSHLAMLRRDRTRLCGRKKLPFAGYSVVKELAFEAIGCRRWRPRCRAWRRSSRAASLQSLVDTAGAFPLNRPSPILPTRDPADQAGPFRNSRALRSCPICNRCGPPRCFAATVDNLRSARLMASQPKLASLGSSASRALASEGWRIPGSNR